MTVSSSTDRATLAGNGVTTVFPLPFRFFANSDIQAGLLTSATGVLTPLTLGTHYTLIGAGLPEQDGNAESVLTMLIAPTALQSLYVQRVMPLSQLTDIVNQGRFLPEIHESVFDRLTMLIQQSNGNSQGAIRVAIGDQDPARLAPAAQRANLIMGFDSLGNPIAVGLPSAVAPSDVIYLKDFGVVGDGSDETAKFQAALTAASGQKKTLVGDRSKIYKITGSLNGASDCYMRDINIDASAMTGTKHALVFQGSLGSSSLLTGNVAENTFVIPVASGALFLDGEWALLTADTSYYPYPGYNVARGEWVQVRSVSGNNITTTTPIVQSYTTATGAALRKCSFVENIKLDNVMVTGSGVANSNERGICFRFARYFEVRDCRLINLDQYACEVDSCIKFTVNHCLFRGTFYDGVTGMIFYALALLNSCQYFTVHDNQGSRSRHLIVSTAASSGQGRWGQVMFGVIHDNVVEDCMAGGAGRSFAYEVHGTGQHLLWVNNLANGCYSFMRIEGGSDIQVIGGGCNGYAFYGLILGGPGNTLRRVSVRDLKLHNYTGEIAAGAAIRMDASLLITDVSIDGVQATGCAKANTGIGLSVGSVTTGNNNIVKNCSFSAGDIESTGACVSVAPSVAGFTIEGVNCHGWRGGYSILSDKIVVTGGSVENFAAGGTGFGFYTNNSRVICKDIHFRNINTAVRFDTASANCLAVNNTFTDCTVPTPSNVGTANVVTPNYTV